MGKRFLAMFIAIMMIFSLVGCGKNKVNVQKTVEKKDVEIWVHNHKPLMAWVEKKAKLYNEDHKDVNIIIRGFDSGDLPEKVYTAMSGGNGPAAFDFLCTDYKSLVEKNIISTVDWKAMGYESKEKFASEWLKSAIEGVHEKDGEYYSLPYIGNTWSLFINKDHFKEAGLDPVKDAPKTWQELATVAEKLTIRKDGKLVRKGFDMPFAQAQHWWGWVWVPLLKQYGGSALSEDGTKVTINEKPAVEALQIFYDLIHKYKVTEAGVSIGANPGDDFANENTSMWISGIWTRDTFKDKDIMNKYAVVPLPQVDLNNRKTVIGGYWWFVNNKVDKDIQTEAWKFLQYMTKDPEEQFAETGLLMPKPSLMESNTWKEFPDNEVYSVDLNAGEWPEASPIYPKIDKSISDALQRSLAGDMDPQKSLDIAAEELKKALEEYNNQSSKK